MLVCTAAWIVSPCFTNQSLLRPPLPEKLSRTITLTGPDLNPTELLWQKMKVNVAAHHPNTENGLFSAIKKDWVEETSAEACKKLAKSMQYRIRAILAVREKNDKILTKHYDLTCYIATGMLYNNFLYVFCACNIVKLINCYIYYIIDVLLRWIQTFEHDCRLS